MVFLHKRGGWDEESGVLLQVCRRGKESIGQRRCRSSFLVKRNPTHPLEAGTKTTKRQRKGAPLKTKNLSGATCENRKPPGEREGNDSERKNRGIC